MHFSTFVIGALAALSATASANCRVPPQKPGSCCFNRLAGYVLCVRGCERSPAPIRPVCRAFCKLGYTNGCNDNREASPLAGSAVHEPPSKRAGGFRHVPRRPSDQDEAADDHALEDRAQDEADGGEAAAAREQDGGMCHDIEAEMIKERKERCQRILNGKEKSPDGEDLKGAKQYCKSILGKKGN